MRLVLARAPQISLPRLGFGLGVGLFALSMIIVKLDSDHSLRWPALWLWLAAVAACGATLRLRMAAAETERPAPYPMLGWYVCVLGALTRFALLGRYPFFTLNDPLRDGGWDAMRIVSGELDNIFAYGRYESHGLLIPTITSVFFRIFGNTELTFKLPAAIAGAIDIALVFWLALRAGDRRTGLFAAVFLICMPLHLYYSRTEIVVICSSLLMTCVLLSLRAAYRQPSLAGFAQLGLTLGLCMNFHASIRTVVFWTIPIAGWFAISRLGWRRALKAGAAALALLLVGFGPRLWMSSPAIIFHAKTIAVMEKPARDNELPEKFNVKRLQQLPRLYRQSLLAYVHEGISSHYRDRAPLLSFAIGACFLVGLAYALLDGDAFWRSCAAYALLVPLSNSALTEAVNADHRLGPIFPLGALLAGYGASLIAARLGRIGWRAALHLLLIGAALADGYGFFKEERATMHPDPYQSFMVTYLAQTISQAPPPGPELCLKGSQATVDFLRLNHIREYLEYRLPERKISYEVAAGPDQLVQAYATCAGADAVEFVAYCEVYVKFVCPPDRRPIYIQLERR